MDDIQKEFGQAMQHFSERMDQKSLMTCLLSAALTIAVDINMEKEDLLEMIAYAYDCKDQWFSVQVVNDL